MKRISDARTRLNTASSCLLIFFVPFLLSTVCGWAQSGTTSLSKLLTSRGRNAQVYFTYSPTYPRAGQEMQFTDASTNSPSFWHWNFGDGTTSTLRNPSHAFAKPGFYRVSLTAGNSVDSAKKNRTISVKPSTGTASFTYLPESPTVGTSVQFTDTSTNSPTSWKWDFGDGTTTTSQNPTHTYGASGTYTVALTVSSTSGSKTATRTVNVSPSSTPTASFGYSPASPEVGQVVQFTDTSTNSPTSWQWDFGDGTTSIVQNPSHIFTVEASYSVNLIVNNRSGSDSTSRTVNISSSSTPTASFGYGPASPEVGQVVQFTDTSTNSPTSWQWDFGDGTTSTVQNPSHSYAEVGTKTVTLTVANSMGSDSTNRSISVVIASSIIINHSSIKLGSIPDVWILAAKANLHIAYGGLSHASQISYGMEGLVTWSGGGTKYDFNNGGADGALDFRAYIGDFGGLGIASSLEQDANYAENRTAFAAATRAYLAAHPEVNVVWWMWCYGANSSIANMDLYLSQMEALETEYPNVKFVYATGRTRATGYFNTHDAACNAYIRDYCVVHNKILYDFYDIECYDPDGAYYGDKWVDENCDYDSDSDMVKDRNWATEWQTAHPNAWYQCISQHSKPLNANMKAYAAWWLFARLVGWEGQ